MSKLCVSSLYLFLVFTLLLAMLSPLVTPIYAASDLSVGGFYAQALPAWWQADLSLSHKAVILESCRALPAWWPPGRPVAAPRSRPLRNGSVDHFAVTVPLTATAGLSFNTVIEAQDSGDARVGITTTVSLTTTNGGTISPITTTLISGTGSLSVSLTTSGIGRTVRAVSGTITGEAVITIYAANLMTFTLAPDLVQMIVGESQIFTATGTDQYSNRVSLAPNWDSDVGTAVGDTTGPTATATFTAQTVPAFGVITVTQGGVSATASVSVVAGPLATLTVMPYSATVEVGLTQPFTATGTDQYDNRVPVTPAWSSDVGTAVSDTAGLTATATFTAQHNPAPDTGVVTATQGGVSATADVYVVAGPLTTITVTPNPATVTVALTQIFAASGTDRYDNAVTISPTWSTNGGLVDLGPAVTSLFTAQITATVGRLVTATQGAVSGTALVNIPHGPVATFVISPTQIETQTAGANFALDIEAQDVYGNQATRYSGLAALADTSSTIAPTSLPFSDGVWSGVVSITHAAEGGVITVTDGATTAHSNGFTVLPAELDHFDLAGYPTDVVAGESFANSVVVTAYDEYNNVKTNYTDTVHFTSDDPQAVLPYTAGNPYTFTLGNQGVHSFNGSGFELRQTITRHVTVVGGAVSEMSADIIVHPAALHHFDLDGYPSVVTAGVSWDSYGVTVTAYDEYNNVKTDYYGSDVYFVSDDPIAVLPNTASNRYTFVIADQGSHNFDGSRFELRRTIFRYIEVTDDVISERSADILVNPTTLASFEIISALGDQVAGVPFNVEIIARDTWNNLKTNYSGRPDLTDATGTLRPTRTGVNCFWSDGICQESITITRAWTADSVTVADGSIQAVEGTFDVAPAPPDHIRINRVPNNGGDGYGYDWEVGSHEMDIYETYDAWAACYDQYDNYCGDVNADWGATGVLTHGLFAPNPGISTAFTPAPILSGTGTIIATSVDHGFSDDTGEFHIKAPRLTINKIDLTDPVPAAGTLLYVINYVNVGNAAARGVSITETYDPNVSYYFATLAPDSGTDDLWTLGDLGVGGGGSFNLLVNVDNSLAPGTVLTNLITIGGLRLSQDVATETTVVTSAPDLTLTLTAQPNSVDAGGNLVYQIHYANNGTAPVTGVVITMTYDDNVTFLSSNPSPKGGTDNVWEIGMVGAGSEHEGDVYVTVVVDDFMEDQDTLFSRAEITDDQGDWFERIEYTTVRAPLLELSQVANPTPAVAFDQLVYTLVYSNVGHSAASALYITDAIPANTDYASCQPAPCSHNAGIVTWQPGGLGVGSSNVITMVVDVHRNLDSGTILTNSARVRVFTTPAYSAASQMTSTVVSLPSLLLSISDGKTSVEAGEELVYVLRYDNTGNGKAYGTTIVATPPSSQHVGGLRCLPAAYCELLGGQVVYDLGTVPGGASRDVSMIVTVRDPLPAGDYDLTALAVISTVTPGEPPSGNTAQDVDDIATRPDVQVQVDYHNYTPYPDRRITYTVRYSNMGHIATTGVVVSATLSEHAIYDPDASSIWQPLSGNQFTFSVGALDYAENGSLSLVMTLPAGTFTTTMSDFDALFEVHDDGGSGADSDPGNNVKLAPLGVPDVIVESVEVNWISLLSHQPGQHVTVTLRNLGSVTACNSIPGPNGPPDYCTGFWIDLYVNPDQRPPSYPSDNYYGEASRSGIRVPPLATKVVTLTFQLPAGKLPPLFLYVRVDNLLLDPERPFGSVPEYDEWNNVFGPVVPGHNLYLPVVMRNY